MHNMGRLQVVFLLILMALLSACASSRPPVPPGTIPKPRAPTVTEEQYGHTILNELSKKWDIDYNDPRLDTVTEIVDRLTLAAGAGKDPWHVYLFRAPAVKNAAATRGNHVFVWSGLLDFAKNDSEIATFISHEIAHVLAGHTDPDPNEEVKRLLIELGAVAAGVAVTVATNSPSLGDTLGQMTQAVTNEVGTGLLINPYSRDRELEADHVGLFLMADAGYDPELAVDFWSRVQNTPGFTSGVEFFSTHPPPLDRLAALQQNLPEAKHRYQRSGKPPAPNKNSGAKISSGSTSTAGDKPPAWTDKYYQKLDPPQDTPSGTGQVAAQQSSSSSGQSSSGNSSLATDPTPKSGDSFDWSTQPALPVKQQNASVVSFEVRAPKALLYSKPSITSNPIGEFRHGAVLTAVSQRDGWVEIQSPDHGYLLENDLRKR